MGNPSKKNPKPIKEVSATKGNIKKLEQSELGRKRASKALRQSEEYFKAIIQNSSDVIFVVDKLGVITYASPSVEYVLGYGPHELIGKSALDLIASNDRPRAIADFAKALLVKEVLIPNVFCIKHKNGTERILEGIGNNLLDNPSVAGFVMNVRDITERRRVEMELSERTASLEERTREMEAANKELESFSYSVSHDLRAPLRAIDGYSRMILKKVGEQFDEETRQCFQVIRENAEAMGRLIDDLLAFSRLGRQEVTKVSLNMDELIRDAWQELITISPDRAVTLKMEPMSAAFGDKALIRQVYGNLLGNAVKFTQRRNPAVIEAGCSVQKDEKVYYIRDNGIGFDMKFYDKLFGVFQRLHSEEEYKGTGIGLALVQRIIQRHGGRVWAESEADKGATFYFSLPTFIGSGI